MVKRVDLISSNDKKDFEKELEKVLRNLEDYQIEFSTTSDRGQYVEYSAIVISEK